MISKFTITKISNNLADDRFIAYCKAYCSELNTEIYSCLDKAWSDERISKTRKERIKDNFSKAMMERSEENV